MAKYLVLVEAYYSDGSKTVVKFHIQNYTEFRLTYTDYNPNNLRDRRKNDIMPRTASTVHQLFAHAHAAVAGCRFAKWYFVIEKGELAMPHFPDVYWNINEK